MKTLQELHPLIVDWAKQRNIHLLECAPKQRLKLIEECGELASAILKNDVEKQKDAIGDIFVVLVILSEQISEDLIFEFNPVCSVNYFKILFQLIYYIEISLKDSIDYLNDISLALNLDLEECANIAWNEIKDRKGQTVDGTFIKN